MNGWSDRTETTKSLSPYGDYADKGRPPYGVLVFSRRMEEGSGGLLSLRLFSECPQVIRTDRGRL